LDSLINLNTVFDHTNGRLPVRYRTTNSERALVFQKYLRVMLIVLNLVKHTNLMARC